VMQQLEPVVWPLGAESAAPQARTSARVDVASRLRGMW
jgi:hypothetical protein